MSIFCVIGYKKGVLKDSIYGQIWPVVYRVDSTDAAEALAVCQQQRDAFIEEITPVQEALVAGNRELRRIRPTRRAKRIPRDQHVQQEASLREQVNELHAKEAAIIEKYANEMLDPLFPAHGIFEADVEYRIVEFLDDPRELSATELMKRRAELHGSDDDDDEEPNDLDSPGWDA